MATKNLEERSIPSLRCSIHFVLHGVEGISRQSRWGQQLLELTCNRRDTKFTPNGDSPQDSLQILLPTEQELIHKLCLPRKSEKGEWGLQQRDVQRDTNQVVQHDLDASHFIIPY